MKLALVSTGDYVMEFEAKPAVQAGKESTLGFRPTQKGKVGDVPLDITHDKKIHIIIVSKDLSYFDHVHPVEQEGGSYAIRVLANGEAYSAGEFQNETRFAVGGDYVIFADYTPVGADQQVERIELSVDGPASPTETYSDQRLVSETDGYQVELVTQGSTFFSEGGTQMTASVTKDGKVIHAEDMEDILGSKGHMVIISEDTKKYLHVHPEIAEGKLILHTSFGQPGIFRGWLQIKTNGQIHTSDFVLKVEEGKAPEGGHEKHHH